MAKADGDTQPTAERILDAALRVLAREGIAGVTMRAVAREADVAVGLANYYFENKTALVADALRQIGTKDMDLVAPQPHLDAKTQLRASLHNALDPSFLSPSYLSSRLQLWSLAGVDPAFAEINRKAQQRYLDGLIDLIRAVRPEVDDDELERRATDILMEQNGVWLTAILVFDEHAVARALARCESIAFD